MTKKALLIGINYTSIPQSNLRGCIDDIENIADVLIQQYGYTKDNIIQLRDDTPQFQFQPTHSHILSGLKKIIDDSSVCEEIWIHYSGHGSQIQDVNSFRTDGLDEVIVPVDYTYTGFITDQTIFDIIKNTKCKTILIFDSCHSGSICDLQWSFEFNGSTFNKSLNVNKTIANPDVFCLSGCKDSQTSADTYSNELHEAVGAFTDALIHCLKINNYNNIDIMRLYNEICIYISSEGYTQKPMLSCSSVVPNYVFYTVGCEPHNTGATDISGNENIICETATINGNVVGGVIVCHSEENTGGNTGENTGGNTGENTGENTGGNTGENTGGNTGGDVSDIVAAPPKPPAQKPPSPAVIHTPVPVPVPVPVSPAPAIGFNFKIGGSGGGKHSRPSMGMGFRLLRNNYI